MSFAQRSAVDFADEPDASEYDTPPARGFERVPPQNAEAEKAVLGAMMMSRDAIEDVIGCGLKGRDYYTPAHETIHGVILDLYGRGKPTDPIMVTEALTKAGALERVGGSPYPHTLVNDTPVAASAEWYAEIVRKKAIRRRLIEAGVSITQIGYSEDSEVEEALDAAGAKLFEVADERADDETAPIGSTLDDDIDFIEALGRRKGISGVPTGFIDLDALTDGLQEEQLIVVAGRPAMGKSTLGMDFVRACSIDNDMPSAFFSLEMGRREINYRLLSATAKVAMHHIRMGTMTETDWQRVGRYRDTLAAAPIHLDASPNLTLMDIRAKARKLKQRHGIRMIVVDYLQLMKSGARRYDNRVEEVSEISRGLKLLAKELHLPVVALSQLNRGPEQRADKKPQTSDLRESGSIEQDADIVILLHREDAYEKDSPRAGEADLIVSKHRNGPTATITTAFQGHYSRFVDMAQT